MGKHHSELNLATRTRIWCFYSAGGDSFVNLLCFSKRLVEDLSLSAFEKRLADGLNQLKIEVPWVSQMKEILEQLYINFNLGNKHISYLWFWPIKCLDPFL